MDFKQLPLEVAARDGKARRTAVAAVEAASLRWASAEASVNRLIRENKGLRSTERRFVSEAVWAIIRRYYAYQQLAAQLRPNLDSSRRALFIYFLYLRLEKNIDQETAAPHLEQAGLPADVDQWPEAYARLRDALDGPHRLAFEFGFPIWFVLAIEKEYGESAGPLLGALNHRAPIDLRVNLQKIDRDTARDHLRFEGVKAQPTAYSPWGLRIEGHLNVHAVPMFRKGLVDVQDEGSQLIALLAGDVAGKQVADVCAGGGGKLAALAAVIGDGHLTGMDASPRRLQDAKNRVARLGLRLRETVVLPKHDAVHMKRLQALRGSFDVVLADVPCSGTGAWRRHPAERWRQTPVEVEKLVATQREIIQLGRALVRPGGRFVYATCSLLRRENEEQVEWALANLKGARLIPAANVLPGAVVDETGRFLKTNPLVQGTDGFFGSLFQIDDG